MTPLMEFHLANPTDQGVLKYLNMSLLGLAGQARMVAIMIPMRVSLIGITCVGSMTVFLIATAVGYVESAAFPPPPVMAQSAPKARVNEDRAVIKKGRPPIEQAPAPLAVETPAPPGVRLKIDPAASPAGQKLLKRIGDLLHGLRFEPPERSRHFQWMDEFQVTLREWRGEIRTMEETPAGLRIRVKVWPRVHIPNMRAGFSDYFLEDYLCTGDEAVYLGFEDPGPDKDGFIPL